MPTRSRSRSRSAPMVLTGNELKRVQNMIKTANFGNNFNIPSFMTKYCNPRNATCLVRGGPPNPNDVGVKQWHQNNVPFGYSEGGRWHKINRTIPFHPRERLNNWPATIMMVYPHGATGAERTQFKIDQRTFNGSEAHILANLPPGAMVLHNGSNVHRAPNGPTPKRFAFRVFR